MDDRPAGGKGRVLSVDASLLPPPLSGLCPRGQIEGGLRSGGWRPVEVVRRFRGGPPRDPCAPRPSRTRRAPDDAPAPSGERRPSTVRQGRGAARPWGLNLSAPGPPRQDCVLAETDRPGSGRELPRVRLGRDPTRELDLLRRPQALEPVPGTCRPRPRSAPSEADVLRPPTPTSGPRNRHAGPGGHSGAVRDLVGHNGPCCRAPNAYASNGRAAARKGKFAAGRRSGEVLTSGALVCSTLQTPRRRRRRLGLGPGRAGRVTRAGPGASAAQEARGPGLGSAARDGARRSLARAGAGRGRSRAARASHHSRRRRRPGPPPPPRRPRRPRLPRASVPRRASIRPPTPGPPPPATKAQTARGTTAGHGAKGVASPRSRRTGTAGP